MLEDFPLSVAMPLGPPSATDFSALTGAYNLETPYGLIEIAGEFQLSHTLTISAPDDANIDRLNAIIRGRLRFSPATASEPAQLQLQPLPFEQVQLRERLFTIVLPNLIVYSNVDEVSVQSAITSILNSSGLSAGDATALLNEFVLGNRWLTVEAGALLGRPAVDASLGGRRRLDLMVKDRDEFYVNPAYFLFDWPLINPDLDGHPLILVMEPILDRTLFATKSRTLFVKQDGGNVAPYLTSTNASRTIGDALIEAQPGDVVIVLDSANYAERVFMPDGVQLTSRALRNEPWRPITETNHFPTISGASDSAGPVVEFNGTRNRSGISGFVITGGNGLGGHGVSIKSCMTVEVARNEIRQNAKLGTTPPARLNGGGINVTDSGAIAIERNFIHHNGALVEGGGGIYIQESTVKVAHNVIINNEAETFGAGVLIRETRAGVITQNHIIENAARSRGGGIAIENCERYVVDQKNVIAKNTATEFGGGIVVMNSKSITIRKCMIGGASATDGNRTLNDATNPFEAITLRNPTGGGGGIGVYESDVKIIENEILNNEAHRGGGIEFYAFGNGTVDHNTIKFNRTRVGAQSFLGGGDGGGIAVNRIELDPREARKYKPVELIDNAIEENTAGGDGGGVYATAGGELRIRGSFQTIKKNTARDNGGGVRVTFGVKLSISGCTITENECNLSSARGSGGGVSFRNATVTIVNCQIQQNKAHGFAGGGVSVAGIPEPSGGFEIVGMDIAVTALRDAYLFTRSDLDIAASTVTNNEALGALGAGGGVYAVYSAYPVHLRITNTTLGPNAFNHTDPAKRRNIVIQHETDTSIPIVNEDSIGTLDPLINYEATFTP